MSENQDQQEVENLFANSEHEGSWCLELLIPHILTLVSLFQPCC